MALPTEEEIQAAWERLGNAGPYPRSQRARIAAAVAAARDEIERLDQPSAASRSTAAALYALHSDLMAEGFTHAAASEVVVAIAPALVRRDGLTTNHEGNPHP
ncbi:hypothetical protein G4X40_18545 [Rhodococcus sp. D2-41]|uniref:hypothetical protein n=1 Tax=Speluncibacter jeojiensis TaxID=2710754 RepID=UPI002410498D|nr:hypothetical protein [Rhodococcus sp. D2-41]MDG3012145.1 hypothetical protein [Rhodococcus sp. D2-41]